MMALPANAQVRFDGFGRPTAGPMFGLVTPRNPSQIDTSYAERIVKALECSKSVCACHATARKGRGRTHCPAHGDAGNPSLSVDANNGKTTTWHCFSGCTQIDVLRALSERNLLPPRQEKPRYNPLTRRAPVTTTPPRVPQKGDDDYQGPDDEGEMPQPGAHLIKMNDGKWRWKGTGYRPSPSPEPPPTPTTAMADPWDLWEQKTGLTEEFMATQGVYYDQSMRALIFPFEGLDVYKYRPWPPTKMKYGWPEGAKPPFLWPLPEDDLGSESIFLTAGETDCLTLRYHGYTAFAVTAGEGRPCPATALSDFKLLGVERIYVVFDADQAGHDGSQKQAACAVHADFETYVMFPPLVAARGKKDINDLHVLVKRNTTAFKRWFDAAVEAAYRWTPRRPGPYLSTDEETERPMPRRAVMPGIQIGE
jgi:hypothetical protein